MAKTKKSYYRKRRQTRHKKQKGGSPSGYTIVGFTGIIKNSSLGSMLPSSSGSTTTMIPICLPDHEIPGSLQARMGSGQISIILPELYKVEWVHGKLDFLSLLRRSVFFYDRNEKRILLDGVPPPGDKIELEKWLNEKISPNETRREIIMDMEATYPGLFIPIVSTDDSRYHYAYDKTFSQSV